MTDNSDLLKQLQKANEYVWSYAQMHKGDGSLAYSLAMEEHAKNVALLGKFEKGD